MQDFEDLVNYTHSTYEEFLQHVSVEDAEALEETNFEALMDELEALYIQHEKKHRSLTDEKDIEANIDAYLEIAAVIEKEMKDIYEDL